MRDETIGNSLIRYLSQDISLYKFLKNLPEDTERTYEIYIGKLVSSKKVTIDELKHLIDNIEFVLKTRYSAFFTLCTIYRRNKEYTLYGHMLKDYYNIFNKFISYNHLKAMYLVEVAQSEEEMRYAIEVANNAAEQANNNSGFIHSYSLTVVNAFEQFYMDINNIRDKEHLDKALIFINKAIDLEDDYAKFYSTRGRLKAIIGNYNEAKMQINKAIDIEDSSKDGYVLRISDYQKQLLNISFKENMNKLYGNISTYETKVEELENQVSNYIKKLEEMKNRNLEFLGFFTALISFTIGSIQVLDNQNIIDAARLIIVLGGSLLIVLGGFGLILNGNKNIKRAILVAAIGLLMITVSLFSIAIV
jgi:tetratricopeptide (TPR) repeat protein